MVWVYAVRWRPQYLQKLSLQEEINVLSSSSNTSFVPAALPLIVWIVSGKEMQKMWAQSNANEHDLSPHPQMY